MRIGENGSKLANVVKFANNVNSEFVKTGHGGNPIRGEIENVPYVWVRTGLKRRQATFALLRERYRVTVDKPIGEVREGLRRRKARIDSNGKGIAVDSETDNPPITGVRSEDRPENGGTIDNREAVNGNRIDGVFRVGLD